MRRYISLTLILLVIVKISSAQEDIVRIVKTFEPTISEARKPDFRPQIVDTTKVQPSFSYKITPYQFSTSFMPEGIKPAKLLPESDKPKYGSYVKLGFGSNISPLADIRLNGKYKRNWLWGVEASHLSAFGSNTLNDIEYYPHFSNSRLKLEARRYFQRHLLISSLGIKNWSGSLYGIPFDGSAVLLEENLVKNSFLKIMTENRYHSIAQSGHKSHSNFGFDYFYLRSNSGEQQHETTFDWHFQSRIKKYHYEIESAVEFIQHSLANDTSASFLVEINPAYIKEKEEWKFKLGLKSYTEIGIDEEIAYLITPDIRFEFSMAEDYLHAYFGMDGDFQSGSLNSIVEYYPQFNSNGKLLAREVPLNIFVGLRGMINDHIKYHVTGNYAQIENQAFFYAANLVTSDYNLNIAYDSTDYLGAEAEIVADYEKLQIGLRGKYNYYFSMKTEDRAWLIPPYAAGIFAKYNIQNKIEVGTEFFVLGKRYGKDYGLSNNIIVPSEVELAEAFNWDIDVEYKYNNKVSAFLNFKNILNNKYYVYNNYPVFGFRVYGGVVYSF